MRYIIPLLLVLIIFSLATPVFAQEFTTYRNTKYGFNIQYPLNWVYHEYVFSGEIGNAVGNALKDTHFLPIVTFCPQVSGKECDLNRDSSITMSFIDKLKKSDKSIEKVLQIPYIKPDNVISSEPTTISGVPAQKIVYTTTLLDSPQVKDIKFIFIEGDKAYEIQYTPSGFPATNQSSILPNDAQKILDSLRFD